MISGGSGRGIVELSGFELQSKVRADAKKMSYEAGRSEKVLSNLVGEARYQQLQTAEDRKPRRR
jgi:hypothetical protein